MAMFTLLHVSDLHFATEANRRISFPSFPKVEPFNTHDATIAAALELFCAQLALQMSKKGIGIDQVIITGDIANTGKVDNLRLAKRNLDRIVELLRSALTNGPTDRHGSLTDRIFLVPGNHDRYITDSRLAVVSFSEDPRFEEIFSPYWPPKDCGQRRLRARTVTKSTKTGTASIELIGIDFSLKRPGDATLSALPTHWGQGLADGDTLQRLMTYTSKIRKSSLPIWVMHFPPSSDVAKGLLLRNSSFVRNAALSKNCRVPLVLCGHVHDPQRLQVASECEIWLAHSATQFSEPNGHGVHLTQIEIEGSRFIGATRTTYRFDGQTFRPSFFEDKYGSEASSILPNTHVIEGQ